MELIDKYTELLKIYFEEWKYRLDRYRKQISQLVVIIFLTTSLPISVKVFENVEIPSIPLIIFPLSGILLTFIFMFYCLSEAARIKSLDKIIKKIISNNYPEEYVKTNLDMVLNKKLTIILNARMTIWVPIALFFVEIIIALIMIYLICTNQI